MMANKASKPFYQGYRMPAEWDTHEATWLAWPKDPLTFPEWVIEKVEQIYSKMILALSRGEKVNLLVDDEQTEHKVSKMLADINNLAFYRKKTADVWIRDYGPIFVRSKDDGIAAIKWKFNAWGNKYDELKADDKAGMEVAESTGFEIFEPGFVLEGG